MTGGRKLLLLSGALAATGCTANHQVQVRAIPYPGATSKTGSGLLAQARGQLALGDVGLALETFRTLQREQPENPEVFEGIAQCYAAMSRYDLVRTNLEFALAYAPNDPRLLNELAGALDRIGEPEQALQVRAEASRLIPVPAHAATEQAAVTPVGVPRTGSVTVKLPAPTPIAKAAASRSTPRAVPQLSTDSMGDVPFSHVAVASSSVNVAAAPRSLVHGQSLGDTDLPALETLAEPVTPVAAKHSAPVPEAAIIPHIAPPSSRVAVAVTPTLLAAEYALAEMQLPELRLVTPEATSAKPIPLASAVTSSAPAADVRPIASKRRIEVAGASPDSQEGPYLQRTSRREVALVTTVQIRMAQLDSEVTRVPAIAPILPNKLPESPKKNPEELAAVATRVQWLPLKYASMPQNVELLNAARTQGLAARTRIALQDRGWRKIRIGNALRVRQRSLVLYSAARVQLAHRLAVQFRCAALKVAGLRNVVVLLGRDAAVKRGQSAHA